MWRIGEIYKSWKVYLTPSFLQWAFLNIILGVVPLCLQLFLRLKPGSTSFLEFLMTTDDIWFLCVTISWTTFFDHKAWKSEFEKLSDKRKANFRASYVAEFDFLEWVDTVLPIVATISLVGFAIPVVFDANPTQPSTFSWWDWFRLGGSILALLLTLRYTVNIQKKLGILKNNGSR